jgi:ubiquinone biosynthesis protein COQ9
VLALPRNAMAGARLAWRSADRMWRIAGDRATDFNHYSKRGILSALYTSTMLVFLDDDTEGLVTTRGFLDRRIDDVMKIEKLKASWRGNRERLPSLSRFLGRLRYPMV